MSGVFPSEISAGGGRSRRAKLSDPFLEQGGGARAVGRGRGGAGPRGRLASVREQYEID